MIYFERYVADFVLMKRERDFRRLVRLCSSFLILVVFLSVPLSGGVAYAMPTDIADLAERLTPSVVNISAETTNVATKGARPSVPNDFRDFFEDFFRQQQQRQRPRKVSSLGSGFVIDPSGLIVTNNHVVANGDANVVADKIVVTFPSGQKYDAKLIGRDSRTDIAVLKIETSEPLPFVNLANSTRTRVGDWVVAIGNPFGLDGSLSVGVVSAINRNINAGPYDSFIQTDAAINRGNSGGPLFNLRGEVIGVNTAIYSPTGGSVGIGFAIPSDLVRTVVDQLTKYGETRRGWLGVRIQPVDETLAQSLGLDRARGALVSGLIEGGPAEKAGIKAGDVIVRFDGKKIVKMRDLPRIVAETEVDERVRVDVIRRGKPRGIIVKIDRLEDQAVANERGQLSPKAGGTSTVFGMQLSNLNDAVRGQYNIEKDVKGVLIVAIDSDSQAYEVGLRRGEVIVEVDYDAVSNTADVRRLLNATRTEKNGSVLLLVRSAQGQRFVGLPLKP